MKRWLKRIAILFTAAVGLFVVSVLIFAWLSGAFSGNRRMAAKPARPWTPPGELPPPRTAAELYTISNIWPARLSFTEKEWEGIAPSQIAAVPNLMGRDGRLVLRNTNASRSGLAGAVGLEFNWVRGNLEFAGITFSNVAVRYRGNGTYLNSLFGHKQSFKVDLNKYVKGQSLARIDELNFLNSIPDDTYMRDALSEQLFRQLGVPGPRTSYAYLTLDVPGTFSDQALGLYVMVENLDGDYAKDRFGSKKTPIFKPVTYELFYDLGDDWNNYAAIYDLKTDATPAQLRRIVEFAHLVSKSDDATFESKLPDYLDIEEFAAFVAGHVLLSACDGFLKNGQNFYMYLHPVSGKIGFISWDHDHSFGEFGYVATAEKREQLSIWEPWLYDFLFLKRVMKTEPFRSIYRRTLENAMKTCFTQELLYAQVDELARLIRPAVLAESDFRLKRFDQAVSEQWLRGSRDGAPEGPNSPVRQIKRFITNRIASVQAQLDGKSTGIVLHGGAR